MLIVFVFGVASSTRQSDVRSPSITLSRSTLYEENFSLTMLDPILSKKRINAIGGLGGLIS